ncbi:hypothetical protein D9615_001995 [Tricholomella constricta]|uniref:Polysaccharide lyase 14 domain-containing protein n=1 Tax=Tricholomella constricta TaxID=117010 RepID=A0A8H5HQ28_9AGAR|nr:hypothetical protein D9615_001995 [Tricholomella constricta]
MFAHKTILILLAFVLFVNALPMRHGRRGTCRPHSSVSVPSTGAATAPDVNVGGNTPPVVTGDVDDATTTVKSAPTTVKDEPTSIVKDKPTSIVKDKPTSIVKEPSTSAKPTKSSSDSSSEPTSTKPPPSTGGSGNSKLSSLFPVPGFSKSWSTSPLAENPLDLSDATLKPTRLLSALSHDFVSAPDGKKAMKAHFPKGSYTFTHQPQGGLSFYAPGPDSVDLSTAKEATFGYSVYFDAGFAFNKGGKLPGIYGGNSDSEAISCSGGRRSTACFSARLMWRGEGAGEFYTYLPPYTDARFAANRKQCNVAPQSDCNPTYGASVGRGAFKFASGQWTTVSERVRLNDVGKANGELELFVNGKSVISVSGLILRDSSAGRMRGIQMQTFFGGSSPDFASPKSQNVYFSDFSVAITDSL